MCLQADFAVQCLQHRHRTGLHRLVNGRCAQMSDAFTGRIEPMLQGLVTLVAHAARTAQQFNGVVLTETVNDPLMAWLGFYAGKHLHHFAQQRAAAAFADQRQDAGEIN